MVGGGGPGGTENLWGHTFFFVDLFHIISIFCGGPGRTRNLCSLSSFFPHYKHNFFLWGDLGSGDYREFVGGGGTPIAMCLQTPLFVL